MPTKVFIQGEKDFAANMTQLMEIMKGLALAAYVKMKKDKEKRFEKFVNSFNGFFQMADLTQAKNPFIKAENPTTCYILVTSEESFMSGLNSKILRMGLEMAGKNPAEYIIFGKKSMGRLKGEGAKFEIFPPVKEKTMYDLAVKIKDHIVKKVKAKEIGPVVGIYADPVSFSTQRATSVNFLPAHDAYPKEMNLSIDPDDKIYLESTIDITMDYLTQIWITNKLYQMFQDNKMSEFAAQAMQLEGSLQNLAEMNRRLKVQFAKKKQELVDSALREVMSALLVTK